MPQMERKCKNQKSPSIFISSGHKNLICNCKQVPISTKCHKHFKTVITKVAIKTADTCHLLMSVNYPIRS